MTVRSPIVAVLGHVDHGKTMVLDEIRGTAIAAKEAGMITQHVGASFMPKEIIEKRCKDLLAKYKFKLTVPGLLFVDTPGHEAFTSLRKRGGSIADLAVLVIDITQGIQPQTVESIQILKSYKTPFIVAANKIDLIDGWQPTKKACFKETEKNQRDFVREQLDKKIYNLIGHLAEHGFNSDRFDRVDDLTKQVIITPVSAKTGEGFPELLMFLAGLSQKFMEKKLEIDIEKPARGTVLEVKEVQGLGMTIDCIIYEGCIKAGDQIAVATLNGPITTKVKALLEPAPLEEIRDPHKKFKSVKKVYAAAGLKIAAPGLEKAMAGSPLIVINQDEEEALSKIEKEISEVITEKESQGSIVKADALGSLEAITKLFKEMGIPIKKADVGNITKKDVLEADAVRNENRYSGVVFAFNIKVDDEVRTEAMNYDVPIFESDVIYKLQEDYEKWVKDEKEREKAERLGKYIYPAKIKILPNCVFRSSKPAIIGVEVIAGIIKTKQPLMNEEGRTVGHIEGIQDKGQPINKAEKGMQVAVSIDKAIVGRSIFEDQSLYTAVPLTQIEELEKTFEDKELLAEIKKIMEESK